eukprot:TRINITY_DN2063_c0_g1_i1.p1 TRINITY_DN2063_c0_g1~~TRINITY_DN2063_c0_g1_i1.p1  ORF type:complete len:813 (+),score=210.76 TRINITY_DN2063_c0_g1_i1:82-2520(+)
MSSKLEKDETIDTVEMEDIDPGSEEMADIILNNSQALRLLSWNDIMNCSLVSWGWKEVALGSVVAKAEYAEAFIKKYGESRINRLYAYRSRNEEKTIEKCMLLLLEGQMLLRELAEYKKEEEPHTKLYAEIREQISKFPVGDVEEQDLLARIAALRAELLKGFKRNNQIEKHRKAVEHKIGLLIQHRSSIFELDRKQKKKKKGAVVDMDNEKPTFYKDVKKMGHYANLFYLLRTEPKYFAKLAYLIPPVKKDKQQFAETVILTMYANAFSPLEEFLLVELLQKAIENEINNSQKLDDFIISDTVVPMMIMSYNKRKQGKQYIKKIFSKPIQEVLDCETQFGADVTGNIGDPALLKKWCETFFPLVMDTVDSLPYGLRLVCSHIYNLSRDKFKKAKEVDFWRAVGYFVYYRFIGLAITTPDEFGLCEKDDISSVATLNLMTISKILKAVFADLQLASGPFGVLNDWVQEKLDIVMSYHKHVIDVPPAEEYLKVNKYAQLSRIEKDNLVILLREIVQVHQLVAQNKDDLAEDENDPLKLILADLGDIPKCPPDDETEIQIELINKFEPQLSKLDRKKNLKSETIDDAIKIMQKIPGFSGDTFLEIFVRMKLHCKKHGEEELAKEVNNVIANLQNLAKHGLVKPDNGFNSFLKDVQSELAARGRRKQEHLKEIDRLQKAIKELDEQKTHMEKKIADFDSYFEAIRRKSQESFAPKVKKFKYKDLAKLKVIADSEIPTSQQAKVTFTITQTEMDKFEIEGKIKGLPGFTRDFKLELEKLLECKEDNEMVFDTEKGLELNVDSTLLFLNKNFFSQKK